jgi:hypothetical protein
MITGRQFSAGLKEINVHEREVVVVPVKCHFL